MRPFLLYSLTFLLTYSLKTVHCRDVCRIARPCFDSRQCPIHTEHLPKIALITMGGTISGKGDSPTDTTHYKAGAIDIEEILHKIKPEYEHKIDVVIHRMKQQPDSIDLTLGDVILLRHAIAEQLSKPDIDGVVLLHGSTTAIEVATAMDHTIDINKPVVFTVAFKPHTAYGAEGPGNLLASIRTVATSRVNRVVILANDQLFLPYGTRKENNRFVPGRESYVGDIINFQPKIRRSHYYTPKKLDISKMAPDQKFPTVEGFVAYLDFSGEVFKRTKADVIVLEAMDQGYWPAASREVIEGLDVLVVVTTCRDFVGVCGRIRGAVCADEWTLRVAVVMTRIVLALELSERETMDFINRPLL